MPCCNWEQRSFCPGTHNINSTLGLGRLLDIIAFDNLHFFWVQELLFDLIIESSLVVDQNASRRTPMGDCDIPS